MDVDAPFSVVVRRCIDPATSDDLARAVVEAVDAARGTSEVSRGPPLYESVDVDALFQVLFGGRRAAGNRLAHERLSFEYGDFTVVVSGEGRVDVGTRNA